MFRWMFKVGVITFVILWAQPSLGRRQEGHKQLDDVPYGVDEGDGASGRHRRLLRNEADEEPSLEAADRRLPSRRRITSENAFSSVMEGGTNLAVTCRGIEGCAGGETVLTSGSPGKDASALTSEEGNHDEAQHEVATVPGVATAGDFFSGDTIQINLPNVNVASSESVTAATTGEQQKQAAGDVSATFTPESVADLLAQLEARKKAKDEDRLCNTEKEQECYQPCKDRNDCAQESGDDKEECKQNCRAKCCKAKDKNLHLFTKKDDSDDSSSKKSQDTKKKEKRSSAASEFERMCNTAPERRCREQCFRDKSCGSSDSEDDETCKKKCRSNCCSFSRTKAKQGDAIKEANERLCNTSAERTCRKSCFESRECGDSDDCKKKCRFKCCYEDDRLCNTPEEKTSRNDCFEQEGCTGSNDEEDRNCMAICRYQNCEFEDAGKLCNLQYETSCRDQCIASSDCGKDENCIKKCMFQCCDDDDRLCDTLAEKARRNTCFMDMGCKDSDEDCQRLCRFRSCEREDDSLCDRIPEKLCRTNCIIKSKCKEDDEHCIKMCRFKCCEDENDRLCNFVGEKQCRQECMMENSCDDDDSDCLRSCRYGCCEDEEADVLCNRSEEKLCKVKCVIMSKCEDDDAQCQRDCRTRCCKKSDRSKSSSSEFSEFCDTEGEVRCRQNCYDSEKCNRDDKECRAKCRENCCDEDNDLKGDDRQDSRNEPAPTPRPTSSSETLCNGITRTQRASVILMRLSLITAVGDVYSDGEVDSGTPQGQAYKWILAEDDRVLCPLDTTLEQRYVLAVLYYSTNGKEWTDNDKWLSESSECSWRGVTCNFRGEVDTIELPGFNLVGELPSELQALTSLDILGLEDNKVSGRLLQKFNDGLVRLRLSNNQLTGEIPSTLPLSLIALYLNDNDLEGTLDGVIGSLPNMRQMQLQGNNFSGDIPKSLKFMENLRIARFEDNKLEGSMPQEVCDMKSSNSGLAFLSVDCEDVNCDCCIPECTER